LLNFKKTNSCSNIKILTAIFLNGDWGLGIGDWGLGIGPNPQSPIPNPQSPIPNKIRIKNKKLFLIKLY